MVLLVGRSGQFGWFREGKVPTVDRTRRTGRHVIIHAITKDGLLCASRCDADSDLSVQTENAEYIYEVETEKKEDNPTHETITDTHTSHSSHDTTTDSDPAAIEDTRICKRVSHLMFTGQVRRAAQALNSTTTMADCT